LTLIHVATLLEYSARHLALMEWAAALKLFNYACIGFALFVPWGIATSRTPQTLVTAVVLLGAKLLLAGTGLALIETVSAKFRVFRAPEFLATAFLFAVLGLLVRLLLGA
jgi:formate hydrogenlyase subunit 4